jgi:hypothetical protein
MHDANIVVSVNFTARSDWRKIQCSRNISKCEHRSEFTVGSHWFILAVILLRWVHFVTYVFGI